MLARMGRRYGGASGGKPCQDISDKFHRKRHRLRPRPGRAAPERDRWTLKIIFRITCSATRPSAKSCRSPGISMRTRSSIGRDPIDPPSAFRRPASMDIFRQLIGPDNGDATALQLCARAALLFAFGILCIRIAGRRTFAQYSPLDIIVAVKTIAVAAGRSLMKRRPLTPPKI